MTHSLIEELKAKMPEPAICLIGERCRLGAFHDSYATPLWHLINEDNAPGLGRVGPTGNLAEEEWVRKQASRPAAVSNGDFFGYVVFTLEDKLPIGTIALAKSSAPSGLQTGGQEDHWGTGTFIGTNWRGRGIGTEAKMLLLNWASLNLPPMNVYSSVLEFNEASRRTQEKCGYKLLGTRPRFAKDAVYYRNGRSWKEIWLNVQTGPEWLTRVWNPYAKAHGLEIWDPEQI